MVLEQFSEYFTSMLSSSFVIISNKIIFTANYKKSQSLDVTHSGEMFEFPVILDRKTKFVLDISKLDFLSFFQKLLFLYDDEVNDDLTIAILYHRFKTSL